MNYRDANEEEVELIEEYLNVFDKAMSVFGLVERAMFNYPHTKMITMLMEIEELFEQTPKIGTGQKL